jgi:hypothetical protein
MKINQKKQNQFESLLNFSTQIVFSIHIGHFLLNNVSLLFTLLKLNNKKKLFRVNTNIEFRLFYLSFN